MRLQVLALAALLRGATAMAEDGRPLDAASLLFETPQWARVEPGATLVYRYARQSANQALFGPSFEDQIRLHVDKGDNDASRTVRVELFGPDRRRASGPFEDIRSNPVLMLFLEHHVEQLSRSFHANPRYFKNAIRAALRDEAEIEPAEASVAGRRVMAWRVRVTPFARDPNKGRMNGLDSLVYTLAVSDDVPGQIAELAAKALLPDGSTALEERLVYDPKSD